MKDTHGKVLEIYLPSVSPQWTQIMGVGYGTNKGYNKDGSNHYFTFPETFQVPGERTINSKVDLLSTDVWATSLGWEAYINGITTKLGSRQRAVQKLCDLVALPSPHCVSTSEGLLKVLERCLLISTKQNLSYLQDATIWVSLKSGSFCAYFAQGWQRL